MQREVAYKTNQLSYWVGGWVIKSKADFITSIYTQKKFDLKDKFAEQMHMRTLFSQKQYLYGINYTTGAAGKYIDFVI